jgi:hypothetical protein
MYHPLTMQPVYTAGRQLLKVRLLMWASVVALAVCWWQGYALFESYGTRAADGGQLAPLAVRAAWGAGVAVLGVAFFLGMWLYGRHYVAAIRMDAAGGVVEIDTLGFVGARTMRISASAVHVGRFHEGYLQTPKVTVHAPWATLRVDGIGRTLIVDAQGALLDQEFPKRLRDAARRPPEEGGAP